MSEHNNEQLFENLSNDIRYIKDNMVTYREYDHLHNEFHITKAAVDQIVKEQSKREWLVRLGEKTVWVVLGAVLVTALKFLNLEIG